MQTIIGQGNALHEWKASWRVVAGATAAMATGHGVFAFASSQFVLPLEADYGWSRTTQAMALNAQILVGGLAPFLGLLVDRFGPRTAATLCYPALAATYFGLAAMPNSLPVFYALMIAVPLFGAGTAGIVFTRAVVAWFDASRGLALAVSRMGVAISGALLPVACYHAIAQWGWRAGYILLGIMALAIGLPAARMIRDRRDTSTARVRIADIFDALKNGRVLILCGAVGFTVGPAVGILTQLQPILSGKGLAPETSATVSGILAVSILLGTIVTGALIDRVWAPLVGFLFTSTAVAGCLVLTADTLGPAQAVAGVALLGFAQGVEIDLAGFLIARYLGIRHLAAIFGIMVFVMSLASAVCGMAIAATYDRLATYDPALIASAVLFAVAAGLYLGLGSYPQDDPDLKQQE